MSKYQTTQYNHYTALESMVRDFFSGQRMWKPSHTLLLEYLAERIRGSNHYKRLNTIYKAKIEQVITEEFRYISQECLVWGVWYGGTFYHSWDVYPEPVKEGLKAGNKSDIGWAQTHYWMDIKVVRDSKTGVQTITKTPSLKRYS